MASDPIIHTEPLMSPAVTTVIESPYHTTRAALPQSAAAYLLCFCVGPSQTQTETAAAADMDSGCTKHRAKHVFTESPFSEAIDNAVCRSRRPPRCLRSAACFLNGAGSGAVLRRSVRLSAPPVRQGAWAG